MAKKSIRLIPALGWFMLMSGAVFIDRSNNKSAVASMTQAGEDMKRKKVRSARCNRNASPELTRDRSPYGSSPRARDTTPQSPTFCLLKREHSTSPYRVSYTSARTMCSDCQLMR